MDISLTQVFYMDTPVHICGDIAMGTFIDVPMDISIAIFMDL